MRILQSLYALVGLFLASSYAAAVSPLIWPFAVLPRGRRERYAIHGARVFAWLDLHALLFVRKTVLGLEKLPKEPGYLVISNHRAWTDVALLIVHTASQGISKKEVAYVPFFGLNGYLSGAIFFDRKSVNARAKVISDSLAIMKGGGNLHLFPEGTRTRDGRIKEKVHLRLVEEAWKAGIDVVPACVWDTEQALPVGEFRAVPFQTCGLEIGEALPRAQFQDGASYARASWERVIEMARARGSDQPFRT